jgi:hypothetical protein
MGFIVHEVGFSKAAEVGIMNHESLDFFHGNQLQIMLSPSRKQGSWKSCCATKITKVHGRDSSG